MKIKSWWQLLPARQKVLFGSAVGLIVLVLALASIIATFNNLSSASQIISVEGLGNTPVEEVAEVADDSDEKVEELEVDNDPEDSKVNNPAEAEAEGSESESEKFGDFTLEIDDDGMAIMPVTTDPATAAVGAAAVMFTNDFTLEAEEYIERAVTRITHPAESYKGPEGEIHTYIIPDFREYLSPEAAMQKVVDFKRGQIGVRSKSFHSWRLINGDMYEHIYRYAENMPDGIVWKPTAVQVISQSEMEEINPFKAQPLNEKVDVEPDTEGATLSHWWVRQEVDGVTEGTSAAYGSSILDKHSLHLAIWCDAPADGGICGVAYTLDYKLPLAWKQQ